MDERVTSARWAPAPGRALATLALAAALLSAQAPAAASAAARPHAGRASAVACRTSALDVWLDTNGNGAAGSTYYDLQLTNLGARACTLRGFPGVSAVDLAGHRLGAAARRDPGHPLRTRTLAPGATATAVLRIVEAANFPASACQEITAAGLRVYPPGETVARVVPFPFPTCSSASAATLSVAAVGTH